MTRRTHTLFATVLASVALLGAAQAHSDPGRNPSQASGHRLAQGEARPIPAALAQRTAPTGDALVSLFVQGPKGNEMQLEYVPGNGWRSVPGADAAPSAHKVSAEKAMAAGPDGEEASSDDPLSVFVDGPTGFVFLWTRGGEAWKFVGTVTPRP